MAVKIVQKVMEGEVFADDVWGENRQPSKVGNDTIGEALKDFNKKKVRLTIELVEKPNPEEQ